MFLIVAATTVGLAVVGLGATAVVVYGGLFEVGATRQHWQISYSVLETAMRNSVKLRARDIAEPPLSDERMALRGAACFQAKCVQCHGAPGVRQDDIGLGMQPLPGPLVDARQHWQPRELYWLVRHGLKMTGMPAWQYRLADAEIWELVAFMQHLPDLNTQQYAQWQLRAADPAGPAAAAASCGRGDGGRTTIRAAMPASPVAAAANATPAISAVPTTVADVQRGRQALNQYACTACHSIPGVTGPDAYVGPPLDRFARRGLIAGTLPNSADNLARWLVHTQQVKPGTAMPELGVQPQDAHDMAAYLLTLQ